MNRCLGFLLTALIASAAQAQPRLMAQAENAIRNLQAASSELAKVADRDAEVLRVLIEAGRALDDWQKNNAMAKALERVGTAEQYVSRPPSADRRILRAVAQARVLLEPAQQSPTSADLQKLRQDFHRGPVSLTREVVAEEIADLARLSTQLADTSALISKALAGATGAALSRAE